MVPENRGSAAVAVLRLFIVAMLILVAAWVVVMPFTDEAASIAATAFAVGVLLTGLISVVSFGRRQGSVIITIVLAVVWGAGIAVLWFVLLGSLLSMASAPFDFRKYWLYLPLIALAVIHVAWLLAARNLPVRRLAILTGFALAFPVLWWLAASWAGSRLGDLMRTPGLAFLAAVVFWLLVCLAIAGAWRAFKAAMPERYPIVFSAYLALWALFLVVVSHFWSGIGGLQRYDVQAAAWQSVDLPESLPGVVEFVHSFPDDRMLIVTDSAIGLKTGDAWQTVDRATIGWEEVLGLDQAGRLWLPGIRSLKWLEPDLSAGSTPDLPAAEGRYPPSIRAVALDSQDRPWVLTYDDQLFVLDIASNSWEMSESWQQIVDSFAGDGFYTKDLAFDLDGRPLLTTDKGIYREEADGSWILVQGSPSWLDDLWIAPDGTLLGSTGYSLYASWDSGTTWHYQSALSGMNDRDGEWAFHEDGSVTRWSEEDGQEALADPAFKAVKDALAFSGSPPQAFAYDSGADSLYFELPGAARTTTDLTMARGAILALLLVLLVVPPLVTHLRREYMPERITERARAIEGELARRPETILAALRSLGDADRITLEAWRQIGEAAGEVQAPLWRPIVRAYMDVLSAPARRQVEAVRAFAEAIPADDSVVGGVETRALFQWLEEAMAAGDTRAIASQEDRTRQLISSAGAAYQVSDGVFRPVDPLVAEWLKTSALTVCRRMADYDAVSTVEGKLSSLAEALGQLTPIIQADVSPGREYPEVKLSRNVVNHWRMIIDQELRRVRGPVTVRAALASRTVPDQEQVTLSIVVENIGHVPAVNVRVSFNPGSDYELIGAGGQGFTEIAVDRLPAGGRTQADFVVRPASHPDMRVLYAVSYEDEDGKAKRNEYPDVVSLLSQEPDFKMIPNPYIPGTPVETSEMFFGRGSALAFARANLVGIHQNNVLVFYGQRRIGKTSILKQLPRMMDANRFLFVFLDIQGYADVSTANFLFDLADDILFFVGQNGFTPPNLNEAQFNRNPSGEFNRLIRDLRPVLAEKILVLMMDEFESLETKVREGNVSPEVYELLRHHMQHSNHLAFIFAGTERLFELSKDYWSVLFNTALFHEVGFLDGKAAAALVTEPVKGHLRVDDQAVNRIVELTSGHAYYIQVICRHLVNQMNEERRSIATVSDVNEVLQATIDSATAPISYIYQEQASPEERWILSALAELVEPGVPDAGVPQIQKRLAANGFDMGEEDLFASLNTLAARKILTESYTRGHYYRFTVDLVRMWILRNAPLERLARR